MSITAFVGPMFSGKTTIMCVKVERYIRGGKVAVIIRYAKDDRYKHLTKSGGIVTHARVEYYHVPTQSVTKLSEVIIPQDCAAIGIDEIQFFPDNVEFIDKWARAGIHVYAAGLDSDFLRRPFLRMPEVCALADTIQKLQAVCKCGRDAIFTKRLTASTELEVIGAEEAYSPTCRQCHE